MASGCRPGARQTEARMVDASDADSESEVSARPRRRLRRRDSLVRRLARHLLRGGGLLFPEEACESFEHVGSFGYPDFGSHGAGTSHRRALPARAPQAPYTPSSGQASSTESFGLAPHDALPATPGTSGQQSRSSRSTFESCGMHQRTRNTFLEVYDARSDSNSYTTSRRPSTHSEPASFPLCRGAEALPSQDERGGDRDDLPSDIEVPSERPLERLTAGSCTTGTCGQVCVWYRKSECRVGYRCKHCHFCSNDEIAARNEKKVQRIRELRQRKRRERSDKGSFVELAAEPAPPQGAPWRRRGAPPAEPSREARGSLESPPPSGARERPPGSFVSRAGMERSRKGSGDAKRPARPPPSGASERPPGTFVSM